MTFSAFDSYEQFLYSLPEAYSSIQTSTLVLIRHGRSVAVVRGELHFEQGIRLVVREHLLALPTVEITDYGYEVWRGEQRLYWYDAQPHPHTPALQSTHPHHKHVLPDIKHNRVPAPDLSFTQPNLPFLIEEIDHALLTPLGLPKS
ncbi:MAG: DUF6516 family protein [Anaerolineae bacterium]